MESQKSEEKEEESSLSSSPSSSPTPPPTSATTNPKSVFRKEPSFSRWFGDGGGSAPRVGHSPARSFDFNSTDGFAPLIGHPHTDSFDGISLDDSSVLSELPLLHAGGSKETEAHLSNLVRQRSTELKRWALPDVESGLRPSESRVKLDLLEHSGHYHHHHHLISAVTVLKTAFYIVIWFAISTCLTLYNKALLGDKMGKFPAPLLMNTFHFGLQAVLSNAIACFQHQGTDGNTMMSWRDYFTKVAKETEFDLWGFVLVMLAAVMSGFRWSMTQILLQNDAYGLKNPITLMSYVSPLMMIITAIFSLAIDPWHEFHKNEYFNNTWHIMQSCLLMLIGASMAFFMVLTEYILVSATSAVTVTIAGVAKETVTILVAVFYFNDKFTLLKGIGLFTIMVGVSLFNWYKYYKFTKGQGNENGGSSSPTANLTSKYVILDEIEFQDDDN